MCLALRCGGGVLLISPLCHDYLIIRGFMANWGRNFLQKFRNKLKNCKVRVEQLRSSIDESRVIEFFNEKRRLAKLLENEELYWKQRVKAFWLENGDLNAKFFHAQASDCKATNKVSSPVKWYCAIEFEHDGFHCFVILLELILLRFA